MDAVSLWQSEQLQTKEPAKPGPWIGNDSCTAPQKQLAVFGGPAVVGQASHGEVGFGFVDGGGGHFMSLSVVFKCNVVFGVVMEW